MLLSTHLLFLAGCRQPVNSMPTSRPQEIVSPTGKISPTTTPQPWLSPTVSFTPPETTGTPTHSAAQATAVCSPLEDVRLDELSQPDLMKNPFVMPRPGFDDGHPGVDFAYWSRGERKAMLGLGVNAVLAGRVAGIIQNRPPYGYAVIIETPLDGLPRDWLDRLQAPTPAPTLSTAPNLLCPPAPSGIIYPGERSLYLLYAHLNLPPEVVINQEVACGQRIGEVGTTGRSVNPHLHLETRVGPAGASFTEMAHYDNGATENEMHNYCTWRVSGLYQLLNPLEVIQALSLQP